MTFTERHRFPVDKDLSRLVKILHQAGVEHYITERDGMQVLFVPESISDEQLLICLQAWKQGYRVQALVDEASAPIQGQGNLFSDWWRFPLTIILLLASVAGFLSVQTDFFFPLLHWLTYQDFVIVNQELVHLPPDYIRQPWRVLTPVFIHMSLMHIVFNGLWTVWLGKRIEVSQGSSRLFLIVLMTGSLSNFAQFWYMQEQAQVGLFGGMSGVIYGFIGYCWIYVYYRPLPALLLPKGLIGFMLLWLVLCMSGLVTLLGFGQIANMAHFAGLLSGVLLAVIFSRIDMKVEKRGGYEP